MIQKNKTYLVTGATGTIGKHLCSKILSLGGNVIALSRNRKKLNSLKKLYPEIKILSGDVVNNWQIKYTINEFKINGIFHLAALASGSQSGDIVESINTNLLGTMNILNVSLSNNFDFVVGISSDKAVRISGVYGATKFLNEKLFLEYQKINQKTKYRIVRLGNVIYSTDSVLQKWKTLISKGQEVKLSDPEATRYLINADQAVDIILDSLNHKDANPYFVNMKSIRMKDLLEAMLLKYSSKKIPVTITGLTKNENKHEKISPCSDSSEHSERYSLKELTKIL
jgi:FlaA1/EpsC-like NDP-sugar epimerase